MKTRILIVDDEADILEILKYNFEKEGYDVFTANNGEEGIINANKHQPHLIILDVMMPKIDGIETCRLLRKIPEFSKTIILFLTARNEEFSELAGFEAGADDYVSKPIRPRTLIARVKSLLKRHKNSDETVETITVGALIINPEKRLVKINEETIKLPRKEFDLLLLLASKPEKVFTREKIFSKIWGDDVIVGDRTLDVHIRKLRKKIGKEYIITSKGIGYSMKLQ